MKNNNTTPSMGRKGTIAALVVCFVAMITVVGIYTFGSTKENAKNQVAIKEKEATPLEMDTEQANTNDIINENTSKDTKSYQIIEHSSDTENLVENKAEINIVEEPSMIESPVETNEVVSEQITFNENDTIMWPVSGGVIMKYSMEEPVYFQTLDQYKRNPAMIIQGDVGTEIMAAERGIVEDISVNAETGNTIMVDIGGGYTVFYGQMGNVSVGVGNVVEKGQILGTLAEPTKYYSVEGPNLYFEMLYQGESVDPLLFLE